MIQQFSVLVLLVWLLPQFAMAQQPDTTVKPVPPITPPVRVIDTVNNKKITPLPVIDSVKRKETAKAAKADTVKKHSPRKAAIRSAILPGWGQIYNKKYWKLPLVYAAVGIPIGTFVYNKSWYDRTRYALAVVVNKSYNNTDSLSKVHEDLKSLVGRKEAAIGPLTSYRNEFRKNMDYSILFTLLFWGLNVVDATVDAHLKDFDVSDNISMQIKPAIFPGTNAVGVSFVFNLGKNHSKKNIPSLHNSYQGYSMNRPLYEMR